MNLGSLRHALAVVEEGNFSRAAERLGISKQLLSRQVGALERKLGVTLFERVPGGAYPSLAGVAFLEEARAIIAMIDSAVARARRIAQCEQARVRVGIAVAASRTADQIIARFRATCTHVEVEVQRTLSADQPRALRNHRIDVAVGFAPTDAAAGIAAEVVGAAIERSINDDPIPQAVWLKWRRDDPSLAVAAFVMAGRQWLIGGDRPQAIRTSEGPADRPERADAQPCVGQSTESFGSPLWTDPR
jgi:molybdenum-dependent DNA-binding transcriptional regulator ModE